MGNQRMDQEKKTVDIKLTIPKYLRDLGRANKLNFSALLTEALKELYKDEK